MPLVLLTGFWALLRTGELLKLQARDVIKSGSHVVLALGETKMSARDAGVENVFVPHLVTSQLLQSWAAVAKPSDQLIPVPVHIFREKMHSFCNEQICCTISLANCEGEELPQCV